MWKIQDIHHPPYQAEPDSDQSEDKADQKAADNDLKNNSDVHDSLRGMRT